MDVIATAVEDPGRAWSRCQPAPESDLAALRANVSDSLPSSYFEFLRLSNGGEGELGVEPGWFRIWPASEVLSANKAYEIPSVLPGYLGFGSSGGGELLAFRLDRPDPPIVMIPFIPLDAAEELPVAANFAEFVSKLGVRIEVV